MIYLDVTNCIPQNRKLGEKKNNEHFRHYCQKNTMKLIKATGSYKEKTGATKRRIFKA